MRVEESENIASFPESPELMERSAVEKGREFLTDALQIAGKSVVDYLNPKSEGKIGAGTMRYLSTSMAALGGSFLLRLNELNPRLFYEIKSQAYKIFEELQAGNFQWSDERSLLAATACLAGLTLGASGRSLYEIVRIAVHNTRERISKKQSLEHG